MNRYFLKPGCGRMRVLRASRAATWVGVLASSVAVAACKREPKADAAPVASGATIPRELIAKAVNPKNEGVYSGPVATVRGAVRVSGDAPPQRADILQQIPEGCDPAREVYGPLFREGADRALADVLVAVTGYKGYVPAKADTVTVEAKGCAFSTRTVAVTFGQRVDVVAKDKRAYVPDLLGAQTGAQLIAMPGGGGSSMYPKAPGRYVLIDSMRTYATAEVLVLKYATFAVTGLDGTFTIKGVPAGPVTVNAFLPATMQSIERKLVLEEGKDAVLSLEIPFDAKAFAAATKPAGASSAAGPSAPSAVPSATP